jgi:hypothetical protein
MSLPASAAVPLPPFISVSPGAPFADGFPPSFPPHPAAAAMHKIIINPAANFFFIFSVPFPFSLML